MGDDAQQPLDDVYATPTPDAFDSSDASHVAHDAEQLDDVIQDYTLDCMPESSTAFCDRHTANCGAVSGLDNCGLERTDIACGSCLAPDVCHDDNRCACADESLSALCQRLGHQCGDVTNATNRCGVTGDIYCGGCTGTEESCANNQCVCIPPTETELCTDNNLLCGEATVTNKCGTLQTIQCGTCPTDPVPVPVLATFTASIPAAVNGQSTSVQWRPM